MGDGQPTRPRAALFEPADDLVDGLRRSGQDDGVGAVDGGQADLMGAVGQQRLDLGLGQPYGDHRAVFGQAPHEPAAGGDESARVREGERTGDVGRGDLADGVARDRVGSQAPGGEEPVQRDLDREESARTGRGASR